MVLELAFELSTRWDVTLRCDLENDYVYYCNYTLGTTLKIYFSYFPCGKKVVCTDALTKVCALCLLCLLCSVDSSRWFTWVVRVGAPSKILKPHSQISRLGM